MGRVGRVLTFHARCYGFSYPVFSISTVRKSAASVPWNGKSDIKLVFNDCNGTENYRVTSALSNRQNCTYVCKTQKRTEVMFLLLFNIHGLEPQASLLWQNMGDLTVMCFHWQNTDCWVCHYCPATSVRTFFTTHKFSSLVVELLCSVILWMDVRRKKGRRRGRMIVLILQDLLTCHLPTQSLM